MGVVKSMTGFGVGGFTLGGRDYVVEVKSLNHRGLDLKIRTPERFFPFELQLRKLFKDNFARGAFTLVVRSEASTDKENNGSEVKVNMPLAEQYKAAAESVKEELGLSGELTVSDIVRLKDIFTVEKEDEETDSEADWRCFEGGLIEATAALRKMREAEGETLKVDILDRCAVIEEYLLNIEARAPEAALRYKERLSEEIERLIERVDEARLVTEVAILADKTAVDEETVRLRSHLEQMRRYLGMDEPIGRRLDFLCQEILREANTIGSKSIDVDLTRVVVEIKGELEKVREQVQNIE